MALSIVWSEEALEDIESIASYIEKDSPVYASSVISKFFETAELLTENPKLGRAVPEFSDEYLREIFVYSYRLIYEVKEHEILFVAVIHGKRLIG